MSIIILPISVIFIAKMAKNLYNGIHLQHNGKGELTMDYSTFQERLKALMDSHGFGMKALADKMNITSATLSRYLSGNRSPEVPYVVKLAEFFGVSVDWLLGVNDDRYETLPPEIREVSKLYYLATEDDRKVVQAVLNKYKTKE